MAGISREDRNSLKFKKIKRRPGALNISAQSSPAQPSPATEQVNNLKDWLFANSTPRPPFTTDTKFTPQDFEFLDKESPASGCFGTVFQCYHKDHQDLLLAMKLIKLKSHETLEIQRLHRELEIIRLSDHENIVTWYGSTINNATKDVVILMEFMDGGTLEMAILRGGRFPQAVLEGILRAALSGLEYLKTINVAHRDIKPSNILVSTDGRIQLCDFGMSKIVDSCQPTYTKFVGCRTYMSPEMLNEEEDEIDYFLSDIYSLGVTIIECAYGFYPIPMVAEAELCAHLDTWTPAKCRPRLKEDEGKEEWYMERNLDFQPFEILAMINEVHLQMFENDGYFKPEFSKFVNQLTAISVDTRLIYEDLMAQDYYKTMVSQKAAQQTAIGQWCKLIMSFK